MLNSHRKFTVAINDMEYRRLCKWTLEQQNLETGGDLFGLWFDKYTAVVQLVLGPGKRCRRTNASFYQDVQYLDNVGSHLTNKEGLCHIGEWHSHHKLRLNRPSSGDENTVWSNMRRYGLTRFFLFITNIIPGANGTGATVGCFLFEFEPKTNMRLPVLKGKFQLIPKESPFRLKTAVGKEILNGAESSAALAIDSATPLNYENQDQEEPWSESCPFCSIL